MFVIDDDDVELWCQQALTTVAHSDTCWMTAYSTMRSARLVTARYLDQVCLFISCKYENVTKIF